MISTTLKTTETSSGGVGKIAIPRAIFSAYVSKWPLVLVVNDEVVVESYASSKSVTLCLCWEHIVSNKMEVWKWDNSLGFLSKQVKNSPRSPRSSLGQGFFKFKRSVVHQTCCLSAYCNVKCWGNNQSYFHIITYISLTPKPLFRYFTMDHIRTIDNMS